MKFRLIAISGLIVEGYDIGTLQQPKYSVVFRLPTGEITDTAEFGVGHGLTPGSLANGYYVQELMRLVTTSSYERYKNGQGLIDDLFGKVKDVQ